MANYNAVMETQQALEANLMKKFADLESQLKASAPRSGITLHRLQEEISEFKTHVWTILNLLRHQIAEIAKTVEVSEMRHRRKYLLINGVSEDIAESLPESVAKLFEDKLGICGFSSNKFKACHRLGTVSDSGKCRPVLVRFADSSDRSLVWRKKTSFKGTPYVLSEFLTRQRQALFVQARQLFGMRNCWTADGAIIVKLADGSKRRVLTEDDLKDIPSPEKPDDCNKPSSQSTSPVPAAHSDQQLKSKRAARYKK